MKYDIGITNSCKKDIKKASKQGKENATLNQTYEISEREIILYLIRVGSHSDLFK